MRCLLVDDSTDFMAAARHLLVSDGVDVVGTASTTRDALRLVTEVRPDVVLVDINLGDESGFGLARTMEQSTPAPHPRVILVSTHAEDDYAELIETSPAIGFLSKSSLSGRAVRELLASDRSDRHARGSTPG
jgi:DNA-binding NarL/FixJ family response regulator